MNEDKINEGEALAAPEEEVPAEFIALEQATKKASALLSPAALIMFPIAFLLDLTGLILFFSGVDDFFILDLIGLIFIGTWTYFHSQEGKAKVTFGAEARLKGKYAERLKKFTEQTAKWAKRLKWLRPLAFVVEAIPYFGGAAPCWILVVYFELVYG